MGRRRTTRVRTGWMDFRRVKRMSNTLKKNKEEKQTKNGSEKRMSNTLKKNKEEKTNKKWKWKKDVKHVLVRGNWYKVIESRRSEIQKKSRRKKVKRWKWGKDIKHDLFNAKWGRLLCMINESQKWGKTVGTLITIEPIYDNIW